MSTTKSGILAKWLVGGLLAAAAFTAPAQDLDKPVLLVAAPETTGLYEGAVVVVVPKNGGHVGFMLNRGTRQTVASAFPNEPVSAKVIEPIYLGGPKAATQMYAVLRRDPGEGARRLFGDVFVTVSGATVDRILVESPAEARYFAGFVAWDAGELQEQVAEGEWLVTPAEESTLFHPQPDAMWADLMERIRNTF